MTYTATALGFELKVGDEVAFRRSHSQRSSFYHVTKINH
jgi:hypothetical protein